MNDAALQVFSYDEPGLNETLDAWTDQQVPSGWNIDYHAAVTPSPREKLEAQMVKHATGHPVFEYVETGSGKLTARNEAHNLAVESGSDVIIACDADAPPLNDTTLSSLLEAVSYEGVEAANAFHKAPPTLVGFLVEIGAALDEILTPHMSGQCHALTERAWEHAGPFDTSIDQTHSVTVRGEEEFAFRRRIKQIGEVVHAPGAYVLNSTRRLECKLGLRNDQYCQNIGNETFQINVSRTSDSSRTR